MLRDPEDIGSSDLEWERDGGKGDQSMEGSSLCMFFLSFVSSEPESLIFDLVSYSHDIG